MCEIYLVYEEDPETNQVQFGDAFFTRKLAESYVKDQNSRKELFLKFLNNKPPFDKTWEDPETWRPALWDPKIKEIQVYSE